MGALEKLRKRESKLDPADIVPRTRRYVYGQDEDGGAVGTYVLKDVEGVASKIPKGSVLTKYTTIVKEAFASGGAATIALGYTGSGAAIKAATAFDDAAYVGNDVQWSPATGPIGPFTADIEPTLIVAGAALTDGVVFIDIEYLPPHQGGAR